MVESTEIELLSRAVEALRDTTGLSVITQSLVESTFDRGYDALISIGRNNRRTEYAAILKKHVSNETLGASLMQLRHIRPQGLLVTHHVSSLQAEKLKNQNVPFFDTAGNAFLSDENVYIFVSGRRPETTKPKERLNRAFQGSGLRTIFALLSNPGLELKGYRQIAAAARVSHGAIGLVLSDLQQEGYLIDMGAKGRRLTKKEELLRRWVERYPQQLRPKLLLGRYSSNKMDWWKDVQPEEYGAMWGGEVAAARLTRYLRPETKTLYAATNLPKMQARFAFTKDEKGDIEILERFWEFENETDDKGVVPPLLVYADLVASGDDRNMETAEMIYDSQISGLLRSTPTI